MKILLDQGAPAPLRLHHESDDVDTASELGWATYTNGRLLDAAEAASYEALITTDQNLQYQQNLSDRRLRILVLTSTSWPKISKKIPDIKAALSNMEVGELIELAV